jgi:hypothetical protein
MSGVNFTSMGCANNLRYFAFGQWGYSAVYPCQSKIGVAYNLIGSVEYQAGPLPFQTRTCPQARGAAIHQSSKSAAGMLRKEVHHG